MTAPFPHHYRVDLAWETGTLGSLTAPPRAMIATGAPPEFDGTEDVWSPEHLLLSATSSCLMSTFLALARRAHLAIDSYRCIAQGTLAKTSDGIGFARIDLAVQLQVAPANAEQAIALMAKAKQFCIVTNSLKPPVVVDVAVASP